MDVKVRTAFVIITFAGRLLMLHRTDGRWGLPGGGIEKGETPLQAAVREIREETGYHAEPAALRELYTYRDNSGRRPFEAAIFLLDAGHQFPVTLDPNEHKGYVWLTPESAKRHPGKVHGLAEVFEKAYPAGNDAGHDRAS